jgi:DNA-binding HxlR family transcriptional regulator
MTVPLPDPNTEDCRALSSILARVGDKWTVLIVVLLGDGPKRFNEIKRMGWLQPHAIKIHPITWLRFRRY